MNKEEAYKLSEELWELSEHEEENKERMLEIARILVDFYIPNKKQNANDELWEVLKTHKQSGEQEVLH